MNRRELLQSAAALTVAAATISVSAAEDHNHHHDHGGGSKYLPLLNAASDCVAKGEVCIAHCLELLGEGNKSMAACAQSVNQMLALCGALRTLAAQQSTHTVSLAKVALAVCTDCEKECRKHENEHAECKACADSCAECISQCKAVTA